MSKSKDELEVQGNILDFMRDALEATVKEDGSGHIVTLPDGRRFRLYSPGQLVSAWQQEFILPKKKVQQAIDQLGIQGSQGTEGLIWTLPCQVTFSGIEGNYEKMIMNLHRLDKL